MANVSPPVFVSDVRESEVVLTCSGAEQKRLLQSLGAERDGIIGWLVYSGWRIPYRSELELAGTRDLEIPFSAGRDWSPASVFEALRDKGLLTGQFKRVGWIDPDNFVVESV